METEKHKITPKALRALTETLGCKAHSSTASLHLTAAPRRAQRGKVSRAHRAAKRQCLGLSDLLAPWLPKHCGPLGFLPGLSGWELVRSGARNVSAATRQELMTEELGMRCL